MKLGSDPELTVSIYPVGFYRDLRHLRWSIRRPEARHLFRPRIFLRWFRESWRRRSYWNGYLCEPAKMPDNLRRCGSGITPGRAYSSYMRLYHETKRKQRVGT